MLGQTSSARSTAYSGQLQTVLGHEGYLTPAIQDRHIFGATFERKASEPRLSAAADQRNWQQLQQVLPHLAAELTQVDSSHAALRMTTPDRYPHIGPLPDLQQYQHDYARLRHGDYRHTYPQAHYRPGLFVFAGLGSRGLTTSHLCAELLAAQICQEPLPLEKSLYYQLHPARFWIKQIKRSQIPAPLSTQPE
ncbi:MAG: FAD-dependent 5-carboxymethylaminomethyl-2-thiouridine(34) oxidoreductase MnmC [Thiolinea sp.]